LRYTDKIDLMILCGSSDKDLPIQSLEFAKSFNTVDSYDIHAEIPSHFKRGNKIAKDYGTVSVISVGWDPGIFSLQRLLGEALVPQGEVHTVWGKGVSQGHSSALRKVSGVKHGVQYTVPSKKVLRELRLGRPVTEPAEQWHLRVCYLVLEDGAEAKEVERKVKEMPYYFAPYPTEVYFISEEEFFANHSASGHGGHVMARDGEGDLLEFTLALESNPHFTARILLAYARAAFRLHQAGEKGAFTVFDIPPKYLHPAGESGL